MPALYKYARHSQIRVSPSCKAVGPVRSNSGLWAVKLGICWPRAFKYLYEVESYSNLNISLKRQWLELERCLFLNFPQGSHCHLNALVEVYIQPSKDGCEHVFGNRLHDPSPARLEAVLGQQEASQLWLLEREKVCWGDIQWIGWVREHLDAFCHQGLLDRGGSVDLVTRPKTETSPGMTIWAFLP